MNNESMNTVVETFFVEETTNLIHDNDALQKWNERCEELGLTGQTKVVVADKSPIPFLWMNAALVNTFQTLCPTKCKISDFDKSPIPLEVLDAVALCKREEYFYKTEIWYNEEDKDPVVVGYKFEQGTSDWEKDYYSQKYLIARWADVKASLDALIEKAKRIFLQSRTVQLNQDIRTKQRELEDLPMTVQNNFGALPMTDLPF